MNWKEIKEKYPKGWRLIHKKHIDLQWTVYPRILYDFFDEQGILVTAPFADSPDHWCTYVWVKSIGGIMSPYKYKSRKEAEEQAFIKAFEILENVL